MTHVLAILGLALLCGVWVFAQLASGHAPRACKGDGKCETGATCTGDGHCGDTLPPENLTRSRHI